jgi:outer membrane lipoprotein-sorting protein
MLRKMILPIVVLFLAVPLAVVADSTSAPVEQLSAAQIAEKNVQARGGLQAWRMVKTLSMSGKLEAGGKQNAQLPFVLEMKRNRKTRLELVFNGQTAVQVYDGTNGWKLRPFLNRNDVEPYSPEELKAASMQADLDGPLVDYAAKGTKVQLEGVQQVEGHDAYNLKLTLKTGQVQHIWVDAQTFLDVKVEGTPRRLDGKVHPVATYLRDYRPVNGLMIPYINETAVQGVQKTEKILVDKVVVNPNLEESRFSKPQ